MTRQSFVKGLERPGVASRFASAAQRFIDRVLLSASAVSPGMARLAGGRLIRHGRLDDADTLLAAAVAAFPTSAGIHAHYAHAAHKDGRLADAAARWSVACALDPARVAWWCALAACERGLGAIDRSKAAVAEALARAPCAPHVLVEAARTHDSAEEPEKSVELWARLVACGTVDPTWRQHYAEALIRLDRLDEADAVVRAGLERHPGNKHLLAAKGVLAMRRQDWEEAHAVFSGYVADNPDDGIAKIYLARIASVRHLADAETHRKPPQLLAPIAVERVEDEAVRGLLLRFESIGADCEFGAVQRRYGAEPLGLLRWNDVTFASLAAALDAGFEGMGEPAKTELVAGDIGELYVRDRRWDLGMHTFLFANEVSHDALFPKMCRRVAYLRDKFIADLKEAEKILVYKSKDISLQELMQLHRMLKTYGSVRLLHVRAAAAPTELPSSGTPSWPPGRPGDVAAITSDLHVGYLSRVGDLHDICFDEWVEICRSAVRSLDGPRPS